MFLLQPALFQIQSLQKYKFRNMSHSTIASCLVSMWIIIVGRRRLLHVYPSNALFVMQAYVSLPPPIYLFIYFFFIFIFIFYLYRLMCFCMCVHRRLSMKLFSALSLPNSSSTQNKLTWKTTKERMRKREREREGLGGNRCRHQQFN